MNLPVPVEERVKTRHFKNVNDYKKSKPHSVISRTYYQSNKTICRPPQSRETIPLKMSFSYIETNRDFNRRYNY
jgi:hypothetical protein